MLNAEITISVQGMNCQKCVTRVTALLQEYPEVAKVTVSLAAAAATLQVVPG